MNVAGLVIEDAGHDALTGVMAVMTESFDPRFGEAWTHSQCASLIPLPGVWLRVARDGERAVGFAMCRMVAGEAELLLLAVHRDTQGKGVGRRLIQDFIAGAAGKGAERLHLEVRDGNHAVKLYAEAGFRIVGRRRNYYSGKQGELFDALTLARRAVAEPASS